MISIKLPGSSELLVLTRTSQTPRLDFESEAKKFPFLFWRSCITGSWSRGAGRLSSLAAVTGQYMLVIPK